MPASFTVPGVSVFAANQVPPAAGSNSRPLKSRGYNANYLKPDPTTAWRVPMPKPGGFKSVAGTFSGSDAAALEVDAAIPSSVYNATYIKSASKRRYPTIHGPITDKQAFAILQDSPEEQTKVAAADSPVHYNPMTVLETLKLLSKGDISDDALEVYEEDGNRIRAYAAIAKQRALTSEEQAMVDEIGTRLAEEARKLVEEDVFSERNKRGELESLAAIHQNLPFRQAESVAAGQSEELRRLDMIGEAKKAEGDVAHFEAMSLAIDPQIQQLEDDLKADYPWAGRKQRAKLRAADAAAIAQLRIDKRKIDDAALGATVEVGKFERLRDEAEAARDLRFDEAKVLGLSGPQAEAELQLARLMPRAVNPRFAPKSSKASNQAQLFASAVQISQAPPAPSDAKYDAEFALMAAPSGPVEQFIKFNLGHNTSDKKKFHPNSRLTQEWVEFVRKSPLPNLPSSPPWLLEKGRQRILDTLFRSSIVPSEFKVELLKRAGY